jgi:hypothetical protein
VMSNVKIASDLHQLTDSQGGGPPWVRSASGRCAAFIVRDGRGRLALTDDGRAALRALLPGLWP